MSDVSTVEGTMARNEQQFNKQAKKYNRKLRRIAENLKIPGVLDPDDLFQEGLIILDRVLNEYNFDPESTDFEKYFKTAAYHRMITLQRYHQAKMRNWKKTVVESGCKSRDDEGPAFFLDTLPSANCTPEEYLMYSDSETKAANFRADLIELLPMETVELLIELIDPTPMSENEVKAYFHRIPSNISRSRPTWLIAQQLKWSRSKVRRHMLKIREAAASLAPLYGYKDFTSLIRA